MIWAVVALSATYWALRLLATSVAVPAHAAPAAAALAVRADMTRLLGASNAPLSAAAAPAPEASSRFKLVGVAAPKAGAAEAGGVALIAVDGKPARPYRIGAPIDGDLVLVGVEQRSASLGPRGGTATMVLELPALPPPATGSLPPPPSMTGDAPVAPPAPGLARVPRTDVGVAPTSPQAPAAGGQR